MVDSFIPFETQVEEEPCIELIECVPNGNSSSSCEDIIDETSKTQYIDDDDDAGRKSPAHGESTPIKADSNTKGPHMVSLCGLPYSANYSDVMEFLEGCEILGGQKGVHVASGPDGRPNGIAFVELVSEVDVEKAKEKHMKSMGKRYIEVRPVTEGDMQRMLDKWKPRRDPVNAVVLLKGLPFTCNADDIREFFKGLEVEPNGIMIVLDGRGRVCGDGFVHFTSLRSVDVALQRHKEKIKHRYIEVYRSDLREMYPRVTNQLSPSGPWSSRRRDEDYGHRREMDVRGYGGGPMKSRTSYRYEDNERRRYNAPYARSPHRGYSRGYESSSHYSERSRVPHKEYVPPYRSKTGYSVHMRGLPYTVTRDQIIDFFGPVIPVDVSLEVLKDGKKNGNANVDFATEEDVIEALRKDREKIETRYIELYNNKDRW